MTDATPTEAIARLRDMHKPRTERRNSGCVQCGIVWPCPTRLVLDEATAVIPPSAPADRDLRDRIAQALEEADYRPDMRRGDLADAVLAVLPTSADRAADVTDWRAKYEADHARHVAVVEALLADRSGVLRGAADDIDRETQRLKGDGVLAPDEFRPCRDITAELRRMADEAQQAGPARRVLTQDEYSTAWHAVEGAAGEPSADPGIVLGAVLHALCIGAPSVEGEQAANPTP